MEKLGALRYNDPDGFAPRTGGDTMAREDPDARTERKRRFISMIRDKKCRKLVEPLAHKIQTYLKGETPPEDVFKAAHYVAKHGDEITVDFKKKPDVILAGIAMDENRYITEIAGVGVKVRHGDALEVFTDAIVNPASPDGKMAAGLAGAIRKSGGDAIEKEAVAKAPIAPGTAVATGAGTLPFLSIIHAPTGAEPGGKSSAERVAAAVAAALDLAGNLELDTITIPGMGTGIGGLSPADSAGAIVSAIRSHGEGRVSNVNLVDMSEETVAAFVKALEAYDEENG
jgi:O-acetyl-ADP-ribose deacetylase (regulator of RNase III)